MTFIFNRFLHAYLYGKGEGRVESSVHLEQAAQEELLVLRARVAELERAVASSSHRQAEHERLYKHILTQEDKQRIQSTQVEQTSQPQQSISQVEQQLHTLDVIFETITDGLAVYNMHGELVRMNTAFRRLIGIDSHPQYTSLSIDERSKLVDLYDEQGNHLLPEQRPVDRLLRGEILANEDVTDILFQTLDKRTVYVSVSGAPIYDMLGQIIGAVAIFHDVTERRKQEHRTNELLRNMDEFLSIASHELRTPLTTINGNIQLAKRRVKGLLPPTGPEEDFEEKLTLIQELLSRAERQVRVQNRLVSDLLDVSRIQANRLELHKMPCDLLAIVYEVVEDQRASLPDRTINLHHITREHRIPIDADPDRIAQVLTNYLTNALKYSATDHPVEVSIKMEDNLAYVGVRDEGPGLSPEAQKKIWERFYRVPGITVQSGSGVGLGLGLYICRTIIERHNGQIGVESKQGVGSTFWFTLPTVKEI